METHDSTVPYYLESKTKKFMSNFRDINDVFSKIIIDLIYFQMMKPKLKIGRNFIWKEI